MFLIVLQVEEENMVTKNELAIGKIKPIQSLIYEIRGKQVMIDSDVARLYGYETMRINEVVKRNKERFPEHFCFRLTEEEYRNLISQNAISSLNTDNYGGRRTLPYMFTEKGIVMLAGLLKNEIAIEVSIRIVEAFVEMKKFILSNREIFNRLTTVEYRLLEYDKKFDEVFNEFQKDEIVKEKIFYNGQIYDAYSLLVEIIKKAVKDIVIIDNYTDKTILDLLAKKKAKVNVVIITSTNSKLSKLDIDKFNEQYPRLEVKFSNEYHDRFIIIDNTVYHLGASLKDLGKKCFAISKIEDKTLIEKILEKNLVGE